MKPKKVRTPEEQARAKRLGRRSSQKGGRFERAIAKKLSLWLTGGQDGTQLIRSVMSGGWSKRKSRQVGDLAPNGPQGDAFRQRYAVECKHRRVIDLWGLWAVDGANGKNTNDLIKWWQKLVVECVPDKLTPMLIFMQNRSDVMVALPTMTATLDVPRVAIADLGVVIYRFDDLLKSDPALFVEPIGT